MANIEISKPNLILCEGRDAKLFMVSFLEHMKSLDKRYGLFEPEDFGGNSQLRDMLKQLRLMPKFETVKTIIVIRDSETDYVSAKQSVCSALGNNGFQIPKAPMQIADNNGLRIAYALFPTLNADCDNGTLEDLCIKILKKDKLESVNIIQEAKDYLDGIANRYGIAYKRFHKNHFYTIVSSTNKFVSDKVGEAARAGLFEWESSEFDKLKELLMNIIS